MEIKKLAVWLENLKAVRTTFRDDHHPRIVLDYSHSVDQGSPDLHGATHECCPLIAQSR